MSHIDVARELVLNDRDVHLWYYMHDDGLPALMEAYYRLLSPDETARFTQFSLPERRAAYLATRALCRWALSHYAEVHPTDWRFQSGRRGKPSIVAPLVSPPIWFSLAHVENLSVCAVSRVSAFIGVDIESIDPTKPCLEIAESFFPRAEVEAFRCLTPDDVPEEFVCRWALKESFVKACEIGLGPGLAATAFDLADPANVRVSFGQELDERSADWRFELRRLAPSRILALALRTKIRSPLQLRAINYVPGDRILRAAGGLSMRHSLP